MPDQPNHLPSSLSDPSELTTQMVLREVEILSDRITNAVATRQRDDLSLKELLEAKLADTALVREEKFLSIKTQFDLIEKQRVEQKKDTKDAVDAALIAQKEAVQEQTIASQLATGKNETATTKLLDQLASTVTVAIQGVTQSANETKDNFNVVISDLKDRINKIESVKLGATEQRNHTQQSISLAQGIGASVLAILSILSTLAAAGAFK